MKRDEKKLHKTQARMSHKTVLPRLKALRLGKAMFGQYGSVVCPERVGESIRLALVTGATSGIGKETARGLLKRDIETILIGRNGMRLQALLQEFTAEGFDRGKMRPVVMDLSDLNNIAPTVDGLHRQLNGRKIDVLIENAGLWPRDYEQTAQGHELAFGTNVLGHFALRRALEPELLSITVRIVALTGDIYCLAEDSTPDFQYTGSRGGMQAYNRSKLGNIWLARQWQKRYPEHTVAIVHPGVIASNLGSGGVLANIFKKLFMLSSGRGSQTSLYCATQSGIQKGAYYHNVVGLAGFPQGDPALNETRAAELYDQAEELAAPFL